MKISDRAERLLRKYCGDNAQLLILLTTHSLMVAEKAVRCLRDAGITHDPADGHEVDPAFVHEAAMLHDIGVTRCDAPSIFCFGTEPYIRHGLVGGEILRAEGLPAHARVSERHTGAGLTAADISAQRLPLPAEDFLPETIEEKAVCYADKFYSKSGDPTGEKDLESVRRSMSRHGADTLRRFDILHTLFHPVP